MPAQGYEPYVLAARRFVPWYDERFRGYGRDKIQHLAHLAGGAARRPAGAGSSLLRVRMPVGCTTSILDGHSPSCQQQAKHREREL